MKMGKRNFYTLLQGLERPIYIHIHRKTSGSLPIEVVAFDIRVISAGVIENTLASDVWDEYSSSQRWGERFQYFSLLLSSGRRKPNEDRESLECRIALKRDQFQDWLNNYLYRLDAPVCMCGCGEKVKWSKKNGDWNLYVFNHHVKRLFEDPEFLEKFSKSRQTPESKKKRIESQLKAWQDPEKRKKMSEIMKKRWQDPEYRAKVGKGQKGAWNRPGRKEKHSETFKRKWQDPEFREKMLKIRQSPEYRSKLSKRTIKDWKNPKYRAKMMKRSQSPDARARMSKKRTEDWKNPEYREKMKKARWPASSRGNGGIQ